MAVVGIPATDRSGLVQRDGLSRATPRYSQCLGEQEDVGRETRPSLRPAALPHSPTQLRLDQQQSAGESEQKVSGRQLPMGSRVPAPLCGQN